MSEFAVLRNQATVVTGSSSGVGRAIARELAAAGAHVLVHARRNEAGARETVDEIRRDGGVADYLLADLANPDEQDRLIDQAWRWRDDVSIWINNAGADVLTGDARDWSFETKLEYLWRVDVVATIRLSRAVGRRMCDASGPAADVPNGSSNDVPNRVPNGARSIINIGWDQAEQGMGGDSGEMFAAIKGAIMAFTRSLACSLAPHVRVNCLAPGWIRTAWGEQASDYWQQRATRESLLQRWGTPEDVASAARYLASTSAGFLTGQTLAVNGGFRRRD